MFKNLMVFSYKRNWKEAIGFYIVFILICLVLGGIGGALSYNGSSTANAQQTYEQGVHVGTWIALIYCLVIAGILVNTKKLYTNFGYILLVIATGILSVFGGALLGLIIPAIITTRANKV